MLAAGELRVLTVWCSHRGLHWVAGPSGEPSMVLERDAGTRPWQRMVLCRVQNELHLLDETGTLLAEASTLPALLDAVDGGVAEPKPGAALLHGVAALATVWAGLAVSGVAV